MNSSNRIGRLAQAKADFMNLISNGPSGGVTYERSDFWAWAKNMVTRHKNDPTWIDEVEAQLNSQWDDAQQEFAPATGSNEDGDQS